MDFLLLSKFKVLLEVIKVLIVQAFKIDCCLSLKRKDVVMITIYLEFRLN